jgi:hypothetical protein
MDDVWIFIIDFAWMEINMYKNKNYNWTSDRILGFTTHQPYNYFGYL